MTSTLRPFALAVTLSWSSFLAPVPPLTAQVAPEVAARIEQEGLQNSKVMDYLDRLTGTIGHRLTGSDNFTAACNWAKVEFEKMGLSNVHLEQWDTWPVVWNRGQWQGRVVAPLDLELQVATEAWTAGTRGRVRAPLLMAPKNRAQLDLIADRVAGSFLYRPSSGERRGRGRGGQGEPDPFRAELDAFLAEHPIAGWVYASTGDQNYPNRIRVFGNRVRDPERIPTTPEIAVRHDQAEKLEWLLQSQDEVVVEFDIRNRFRVEDIDLNNVIAEIPGTEKPEEVVIVCGHLDSWHQATGTTDNGTGTTSTIEAARILSAAGVEPKRTIRFMLWGGEEQGLLGSRAYVTRHRTEMPNVSAVLNHDTGTNWAQSLGVNQANFEAMQKVLEPVMKLTPPDADWDAPVFELRSSPQLSGGGGSDHASFISARVPAFNWGLVGRSDYFGYTWHSQWDTFDVAIPEYQRHNATVIALTAAGIADLPEKLSNDGVVPGGRGGFNIQDVMSARFNAKFKGEGDLEIESVTEDGVAAKLGLVAGDKILGFGGESVARLLDLAMAMRGVEGEAKLTVLRDGTEVELQIDTAKLPEMRRGRRGQRGATEASGRRRGGAGGAGQNDPGGQRGRGRRGGGEQGSGEQGGGQQSSGQQSGRSGDGRQDGR